MVTGAGQACENCVDADNDGVPDTDDFCPRGRTGWIADEGTDSDGDGCEDETEDTCVGPDLDRDGSCNLEDCDDDDPCTHDTCNPDDDTCDPPGPFSEELCACTEDTAAEDCAGLAAPDPVGHLRRIIHPLPLGPIA